MHATQLETLVLRFIKKFFYLPKMTRKSAVAPPSTLTILPAIWRL